VLFSFSRPFASLSVSDGPKDELERSTIPGNHCGEEKTKHLPLSPNHIHKNIVIKNQGPGFKHFVIFTPIRGEMIQFDEHIFQAGFLVRIMLVNLSFPWAEPSYELVGFFKIRPSPQRPEWFAPGRKLSVLKRFAPPPHWSPKRR